MDSNWTIKECSRVDGEETVNWMINLTFRNIGNLYRTSSWGWNATRKRREIVQPTMNYIIAYKPKEMMPVAFCNWMITSEDDINGHPIPVIYCYELQVESQWRRRGLGHVLMDKLHQQALKQGSLAKIMLTVFKSNSDALKFYKKLSFTIDPISPSQVIGLGSARDKYDYEILSFDLNNPWIPSPSTSHPVQP